MYSVKIIVSKHTGKGGKPRILPDQHELFVADFESLVHLLNHLECRLPSGFFKEIADKAREAGPELHQQRK